MKRIISDLLEYSRVGKVDAEKQRIDVNALVEEIVQLNHSAIEEKNAEILWENLPVVHYAKVPLQQVILNLLGNALKYQKSGHRPRIEIKALETPTAWQFSISDNGIGIDPKHFEKIFGLFKRLHGKGEFSGTGLGLAICKKIVESYEGQIWVDSIPGIGSTFYFTIPKDLSNLDLLEG
jgi:light-regulated signal transduction histidine kinase (bacteriophytochrome)